MREAVSAAARRCACLFFFWHLNCSVYSHIRLSVRIYICLCYGSGENEGRQIIKGKKYTLDNDMSRFLLVTWFNVLLLFCTWCVEKNGWLAIVTIWNRFKCVFFFKYASIWEPDSYRVHTLVGAILDDRLKEKILKPWKCAFRDFHFYTFLWTFFDCFLI